MQWTGGDATMGRSASNTVIIVEDDVGLTQALTRILRLGGLSPVTYTSAEALLAASLTYSRVRSAGGRQADHGHSEP